MTTSTTQKNNRQNNRKTGTEPASRTGQDAKTGAEVTEPATQPRNAPVSEWEVGTTVHVAPDTLLIERNIRDAQPDKDLIDSVREFGVLEPVSVVITTDGDALLVRRGHRRTLAAIAASRATIPAYIAGIDSLAKDAEVERVVTQREENTRRIGLTTGDEVRYVETLAGMGLSAAQIAKRGKVKRADVDNALVVIGSDLARKAADRYESLTLDQIATVAEFENDPETVKALIAGAATRQFEHVAQRARNDRAEAQFKAALVAALEAEGVRVVERPDTAGALDRYKPTIDGEVFTADTHRQCPGHIAWLGTDWVTVGKDGNPVIEPDEPTEPEGGWASEEDEEAAWAAYDAAEEKAYEEARRVNRPVAVYGCENPTGHGHIDRHGVSSYSPAKTKAADMTDDEREEARKARALVIENNKAWDAAETVRREWVKATFGARKSAPKGAAAFLAIALADDTYTVNNPGHGALSISAEWIGDRAKIATQAAKATEGRALVLALVQILAAYESHMTRDEWRRDGTTTATGRYLRFIESCGYPLSDVEKYATSKKTA
ncbi:hypothetical protein GCM10009795_096630 [Nocardioides hankookensis]